MSYYYPNTNQLPKWLSSNAIITYIAALSAVMIFYGNYPLPWYFILSGFVAVLVFFLGAKYFTRTWSTWQQPKEKTFERNVFIMSFVLRLAWTLLIYWIFMLNWGDAFGFENMDATEYDRGGQAWAQAMKDGRVIEKWNEERQWYDISDMGESVYIGFVYLLTGNSIMALRILKCLWSSITVLLMYHIAKRNFGENIARLTAIFCMLWPNFWYYCGTHLKEVEMVFLCVLFVNEADKMLKLREFTALKIIPVLLTIGALFTLRTPLALVAVLSLFFAIFMSSTRVVSWGKRIVVGSLVLLLVGVTMGNRIQEETQNLMEKVTSGGQQSNMEWRAQRGKNGQKKQSFAKYASTAVFAPLIFTIPFPTMTTVENEFQQLQRMVHGANFDKNIISFFTILAMFFLLLTGKWRDHMIPLAFMLGYLVVLAFSYFAQSERFHQPAMPFEMMFAAYGVSMVTQGVPIKKGIGNRGTYKRWFMYWCIAMFVAAIAWNWFKLAGRGMI